MAKCSQGVDAPHASIKARHTPKLAQDRPNQAGHGPKRAVLFKPDLTFLRSGLKLFEHKPNEMKVFFAQHRPSIGPIEPPYGPMWAHQKPITWLRTQLHMFKCVG